MGRSARRPQAAPAKNLSREVEVDRPTQREGALVIVYVLSYMRPTNDNCWAGMFVGVYSSLESVEHAKARMRQRPGFRDFPDGFRVDCYRVDADYDDPMFFTNWDRNAQAD